MAPTPPNARRAPAKPWRSSFLGERPRDGPPTLVAPRQSRGAPRSRASGPEMAPQRSSRPGKAVARLVLGRAAPRCPLLTWGPRHGPHTPQRSSRPGKAVARLVLGRAAPRWPPNARRAPAKPWRASFSGERPRDGPPTLVAPRGTRGAPRFRAGHYPPRANSG